MRISDWSSDVCSSDLHFRDEFHQCGRWRCRRSTDWPCRVIQRFHLAAAHSPATSLAAATSPAEAHQSEYGLAPSHGLPRDVHPGRSEEHTSELQSLMRISYAVFCLKKKK